MAEDSTPKETGSGDKPQSGRRPRGGGRGHRGRGGRRSYGPRAAQREDNPATTSDREAALEARRAATAAGPWTKEGGIPRCASEPDHNHTTPTSADPDVGFASHHEQDAFTAPASDDHEDDDGDREASASDDFEHSGEARTNPRRAEEETADEESHADEEGEEAPLKAAPGPPAKARAPPHERLAAHPGQTRQPQRPQNPRDSRGQDRSRQFRDRDRDRQRPRPAGPSHQPQPLPPPHQPATSASVQQAIEHANDIIENLKETLDEMEEVLETLELAERQKLADERELETLRRSLRQVQRPRDSSSAGPRH